MIAHFLFIIYYDSTTLHKVSAQQDAPPKGFKYFDGKQQRDGIYLWKTVSSGWKVEK
jgi:hypothetical protein